jgi:hypothetical protein
MTATGDGSLYRFGYRHTTKNNITLQVPESAVKEDI